MASILDSTRVRRAIARPGNRFWPTLYRAGFMDRLLSPFEGRTMVQLGYGLTNLVERATARAEELSIDELKEGARRLEAQSFTGPYTKILDEGTHLGAKPGGTMPQWREVQRC